MARLLDPKAFGLVAMAGVFLRFATYFANMGMGQAIVQKIDLEEKDIRSAFTSSIILGVFFSALIWIASPLGALFFERPDVIPIIKGLSIAFLFTGLAITSESLLRRNMNFKTLSIINVLAYIFGFGGVGITSALNGLGVWSLVYATLSRSFFNALFCYISVKHTLKLNFIWQDYKKLFSYGSRISLISFFEFIGQSLDTLIIGKVKGPNLLGIYNRALEVGQLPMTYISTSLSKVLFPAFSSIQNNLKKLKNSFLASVSLTSYILIPIGFGMSMAAEEIVYTVLGRQWSESIPLFQILALTIPFKFMTSFSGILMDSTARLRSKLIFQIIYILGLMVTFYLIRNLDLIYFTYVLFVFVFARNIAYLIIVKNIVHFTNREIIKMHIPGIITAVAVSIVIFAVKQMTDLLTIPDAVELIIIISFAAITWILMIFVKPNNNIKNEIMSRIEKIEFFKNSVVYKGIVKVFSL